MNTVISNAAFIISDLLLLANLILINKSVDLGKFKPGLMKLFPISFIHVFYTLIFSLYFAGSSKFTMSVLLAIYYLRFLVFPFIFNKKIKFISFYMPLLLISLDSLMQSCVSWIFRLTSSNSNELTINKITSMTFQLFILSLICFLNKKGLFKNLKFAFKSTSKAVGILMLLCVFIMEGVVTLISFETDNVSVQRGFSEFFLLILMIVMFVIMLLLLINSMSKKYFQDTSDLLLKQINTQLRHYETLDNMRREFHSFRHDYINHMQCVSALISSNKNEEAVQYINKLSKSKTITTKSYECGNHILDSILTEKAETAKECDTEICLDGLFTHDFDPVDLCVIFSNALDNAIEACRKISGHKVIDIKLNKQQGYQFISISNPTNGGNDELKTTKDDKIHHGFGINNIRNAVNRHNGIFDINNGDDLFCLNVTLKL